MTRPAPSVCVSWVPGLGVCVLLCGHVMDPVIGVGGDGSLPSPVKPILSTGMTALDGCGLAICQAPEFLDGPFTRGFSGWHWSAAAPFQPGKEPRDLITRGQNQLNGNTALLAGFSLPYSVEPSLTEQLDNDLWVARGALSC